MWILEINDGDENELENRIGKSNWKKIELENLIGKSNWKMPGEINISLSAKITHVDDEE